MTIGEERIANSPLTKVMNDYFTERNKKLAEIEDSAPQAAPTTEPQERESG